MYIRIRVFLIIFLTMLVIVSFSVFVGVAIVRNTIDTSQEVDLTLMSDIADQFISSEIRALKQTTLSSAHLLSMINQSKWQDALIDMEKQHPEFIGFAVLDSERNLIATQGQAPASFDALDDSDVQKALQGKVSLSTTINTPEGLVFYLSAPMESEEDRIIVFTLPGVYFSELLSSFQIWETGHIFMEDSQGCLISNPRPHFVTERLDLFDVADIDEQNIQILTDVRQAMHYDAVIIRYSIYDVPRIAAFRHVSGSEEGWSLGAVAPLTESPFRLIDTGLYVVGGISLLLGIVFAIIASGVIKKPFEEIEALKEEAESISKHKSDFLATISHEIRTPMNTILGVAEILMREKDLSNNVYEGILRIYNSGDLLLNIINDILDLSKIEAGKLELSLFDYDVASLINDTALLNMMRIGSKVIDFRIKADENLPQTLHGDDIRIKEILNNMLSNAIKYTEKGKIELSFSVLENVPEQTDNNGVMLIMRVSDTGQGMTAEQVNAIFDRYSRFNAGANRGIEGTGLGMNVTQNLVSLMNGVINVESTPGKGSVFTVSIPQKRVGTAKLGKDLAQNFSDFRLNATKQITNAQIIFEPMPFGSVLIVDDSDSNIYVAKGLLAPWQLSIDTVTSGFDAIDRIKSGKAYDIIFMDHMMPKMDGIEATKIIRKMGYKRPIVALSANAIKGQDDIFLANGLDDFISKPIDIRRLSAVLKKYIRDVYSPEDATESSGRNSGAEMPVSTEDNKHSPSLPLELIKLVILDIRNAIDSIEDVWNEHGSYNEEDILTYTISVHAMKNVMANIGETALSATAAGLEQAGHSGNTITIKNDTPAFMDELTKKLEDLSLIADEDII